MWSRPVVAGNKRRSLEGARTCLPVHHLDSRFSCTLAWSVGWGHSQYTLALSCPGTWRAWGPTQHTDPLVPALSLEVFLRLS